MPIESPNLDTYGAVAEASFEHVATGVRFTITVAGDIPVVDRDAAFQAVIDDLVAHPGYTFVGAHQIYQAYASVTPTA
ncbi:hypothetical protein ABT061_15840 [Streptosporangium sp. NPDC002544]|uniref:hypothetical protein n=1 Tax=Streptosporangium sp. NPDC002544 TaxID=3154538 RepID=UPI0033203F7E